MKCTFIYNTDCKEINKTNFHSVLFVDLEWMHEWMNAWMNE